MAWAAFWALMATLNGKAAPASCRRLAEELSRRSVPDIIGFAERHAEALYRLDQEKFGTLPVADTTDRNGEPFPQSADGFLYARCAVVAAGQAVWESVFFDVGEFAPYITAECDGKWLLCRMRHTGLLPGRSGTTRPGTASRATPTWTAGRTCGTEPGYRSTGIS
ncbi:DUF4240 domain-containing protein [Streptomyces sp. NPDC021080]|uniref:DUF4240 domain-containing protein n=1 Tax=Streptomyces sp. NPDC021080 TaxID=3365110 RepID=UPI00378A5F64